MRFAHETWLLALSAVPLVALLLRWRDARARAALAGLFATRAAAHIEGPTARLRPWRRFLLGLALASLAVALARPQWGAHQLVVRERGTDVVVALDVSNSMLAEDVAPSRLARARGAIDAFLAAQGRGRVGLVLFAGAAYVQCPLTLDHATARLFLRQAAPDMISAQGTGLAQALATARGLLERGGGAGAAGARRAIVLATDGEDFEGGWEAEGQACREAGIVVITVAVGDPRGGLIPQADQQGRAAGYLKDDEGRVVLTRPDPTVLTRLADITGGAALAIGPSGLDPGRLRAQIQRLGERELDERRVAAYEERFQWPLGLALVCLILRELLRSRRRRGVGATARAVALVIAAALASAPRSADASPLRPPGAAEMDRGLASGREGRWEEALRAFEKAHALNPEDPRPALGLGAALTNLGRGEEAVARFRQAAGLARSPRLRADALYDAGTALLAQGEAGGAAELLRESLSLVPDRDDALRNLEVALRRAEEQSGQPQPPQQGAQDQERTQQQEQQPSPGQAQPEQQSQGQASPQAEQPPRPDSPGRSGEQQPAAPESPRDQGAEPQPTRPPAGGAASGEGTESMSREQALELLRALDRDEAELRQSVQKRLQGATEGGGKRW